MNEQSENPEIGKPFELSEEEMDRMRDKVAENPGLLPFAHNVGSSVIRPEDRGKIKGRAVSSMHEQTNLQMKQIYEQVNLLMNQAKSLQDRVSVSERIYLSDMSFEPVVGKIYYLYQKKDGKDMLSLVAPEEWGRSRPFEAFLAKVKLLGDHTWDVLETGDGFNG